MEGWEASSQKFLRQNSGGRIDGKLTLKSLKTRQSLRTISLHELGRELSKSSLRASD
jgi:hypothetical protein